MKIIKYKDWSGWWDGLRSKAMKAGAESLATNVTALLATNGVANLGIEGLKDVAMGWKTALATMVIQFSLRTIAAAAQYVAAKPDPDVETEEVDTTTITKPSGTYVKTKNIKSWRNR